MKHFVFAATTVFGLVCLAPASSWAVACAKGVYRAGCVGPNSAAVVKKPPAPAQVTCAKGVYREGCAGPNGAVVRRRY